jgi:hypothetical protein
MNKNAALVLSHSTLIIPASVPGQKPNVIPMPMIVTGSVWSGGEALSKTLQVIEAIIWARVPALKGKRLDKMLSFKPLPADWKPLKTRV